MATDVVKKIAGLPESGVSQATLDAALATKADTPHAHVIADTTGLQAALDSKAAVAHSHIISDTTGLQAALDSKAASVHTHLAASITDLGALGTVSNLTGDVTSVAAATTLATKFKTFAFGGIISGSDLVVGGKLYLRIPYAGTITRWTIETKNQSGSIVFDVWKGSSFPTAPTISDTIVASAKPTLTTATGVTSTTLTGWTTTFAAGDYFVLNIDSFTTLTWAKLTFEGTRT